MYIDGVINDMRHHDTSAMAYLLSWVNRRINRRHRRSATTREISDHFEDHYFAHGHTYEARPLTLAAGVAAIGEYRRLNLIERSRETGQYLGKQLKALQDKHPSVGDMRGLGLFWGVEPMRDRKSRLAFSTREDKLQGKPIPGDNRDNP